ncbi:MAG: hypothetical protein DLM67_13550 [Candidatus Nephthysia bennettiae]|nr:MAG: hypothetical protein DLM67_13550 [Candidatus Dormibacteraeota bacterium]
MEDGNPDVGRRALPRTRPTAGVGSQLRGVADLGLGIRIVGGEARFRHGVMLDVLKHAVVHDQGMELTLPLQDVERYGVVSELLLQLRVEDLHDVGLGHAAAERGRQPVAKLLATHARHELSVHLITVARGACGRVSVVALQTCHLEDRGRSPTRMRHLYHPHHRPPAQCSPKPPHQVSFSVNRSASRARTQASVYCAKIVPFTPPKPLDPPPEDLKGSTVLVVDDERAWRVILETDLQMLGYRVALAEDAVGALESAEREPPDVAIIDLMLPEPMDGRALFAELQARGIVVPVVFYTAYPVFGAHADEPDILGYMSKAVDRADLYSLLPEAIRRKRAAGGTDPPAAS